jgi:hypothetical protein
MGEQYESCASDIQKRGKQPYEYFYLIRREPKTPTKARPGSKAKIAVLAKRWRKGYTLWHADDAR